MKKRHAAKIGYATAAGNLVRSSYELRRDTHPRCFPIKCAQVVEKTRDNFSAAPKCL